MYSENFQTSQIQFVRSVSILKSYYFECIFFFLITQFLSYLIYIVHFEKLNILENKKMRETFNVLNDIERVYVF